MIFPMTPSTTIFAQHSGFFFGYGVRDLKLGDNVGIRVAFLGKHFQVLLDIANFAVRSNRRAPIASIHQLETLSSISALVHRASEQH